MKQVHPLLPGPTWAQETKSRGGGERRHHRVEGRHHAHGARPLGPQGPPAHRVAARTHPETFQLPSGFPITSQHSSERRCPLPGVTWLVHEPAAVSRGVGVGVGVQVQTPTVPPGLTHPLGPFPQRAPFWDQPSFLVSGGVRLGPGSNPTYKIKAPPHEGVREKETFQSILRNTVKINHSIYLLALFTEI